MRIALGISFILAVIMVVRADEDPVEILSNNTGLSRDVIVSCLETADMTAETLGQLGHIMENPETSDAIAKVGCFFSCTMHSLGLMEDGKLKIESIHESIKEKNSWDAFENDREMVDVCFEQAEESETEGCKLALVYMECLAKQFAEREARGTSGDTVLE